MKLNPAILFTVAILVLNSCVQKSKTEDTPMKTYIYPETKKIDAKDTFFGEVVEDPYRWLEDDQNPDVKAWIDAQNKFTFSHIDTIPYRDKLRNMLEKVWNYERYSAPFKRGEYTYYYKNNGLQNQSVLYRQKGNDEAEVYLDPNTFSEDGTTSLGGVSFSKDGSLMAYQISEGGSDWRKVIVWNAITKEIIDDTLKDVKFSGLSWQGNTGFYYSSYDKPKEGSQLSGKTSEHKLFFHKIGDKQENDMLIFGGQKTPRRYVGGEVSEDENYLIITAAESTTGNELYVKDLRIKNAPLRKIVDNFDNNHAVVHTDRDNLYVLTDLDAPNQKLVKLNKNNLDLSKAQVIIPETNMPLTVTTGAGKFFANYLKDALSYVVQYSTNGDKEREITLPGNGTAGGFDSRWEDDIVYYSFTNFIRPTTIYAYNPKDGETTLYKEPVLDFNPNEYESYQVFYTSKDGTKIPMMITHKKGLEKNGINLTMLYGYGGFNISLTPSFSPSIAVWLKLGGVYAVPNLRGGGEYGKEWHDAGIKMKKQNVFDDFIAAAEYLINEHYTSDSKLAISGGSNGGLLVGACLTQRPELFAVALPAVGVLDMLRYHKFTAGAGWSYDYGTAEDSKEMFDYLKAYSPLHNTKQGEKYPSTLITTGDHDDRVVPAHSFKFAAALQATNGGDNPTMIRIETKAGHGAGKPTSMLIDEAADKYAFTLWHLGIGDINP
ncbi:MAG: S9 family peptidase [Bacteroidetes bacterium]|nr:S9 family peptidase [Bacteroidota bacterium]